MTFTESTLLFLHSFWGIFLFKLLLCAFVGYMASMFVKKLFETFGFYSNKKKKEFLSKISELLSYPANIFMSYQIIKIELISNSHYVSPEYYLPSAVIFGLLAVGIQALIHNKRFIKIILAIGKFVKPFIVFIVKLKLKIK